MLNNIPNTILTLAAHLVAIRYAEIRWPYSTNLDCRQRPGLPGDGACWAFIAEKLRFILFGRYPFEEHCRPLFVVMIFIVLIISSFDRRLWGRP